MSGSGTCQVHLSNVNTWDIFVRVVLITEVLNFHRDILSFCHILRKTILAKFQCNEIIFWGRYQMLLKFNSLGMWFVAIFMCHVIFVMLFVMFCWYPLVKKEPNSIKRRKDDHNAERDNEAADLILLTSSDSYGASSIEEDNFAIPGPSSCTAIVNWPHALSPSFVSLCHVEVPVFFDFDQSDCVCIRNVKEVIHGLLKRSFFGL